MLEQHFKENHYAHVQLAPTEPCKDMTHIETYFQDIIDKGGEGIILRDPDSLYEAGRSSAFLKHKVNSSFLFALFLI